MTQGVARHELLTDSPRRLSRMLNQEIAKLISRTGGIRVADALLREMAEVQEVV